MSRPVSLGYQLPSPHSVSASSWQISSGGHEALDSPSDIPGWQYGHDIAVRRILTVDLGALRSRAMLTNKDKLAAQVTWAASGTGLQDAGPAIAVDGETVTLEALIPGASSGGELTLVSSIFLNSTSTASRNQLAARRPGSILWSDMHWVLLEGEAFRFPTEALDFKFLASARPEAAWFVDARADDLEAPALARLRLFLNTENPVYRRLQQSPGSPEAERTKQFLAYDIARQLVALALNTEELRDDDYPRGSVGQVLRARLHDYFGNEAADLAMMRSRWKDAPGEIESILQTSFAL